MSELDFDPASQSFREVLIKRVKRDQQSSPNLRFTDSVILKDGPRAYKVATHHEIVNHNSGEFHHNSVKIETYRPKPGSRDENGRLILSASKSISIDDEQGDEIGALYSFLQTIVDSSIPDATGEYLVIPVNDGATAGQVFDLLSTVSDVQKVTLLTELIGQFHSDHEALSMIVEQVKNHPDAVQHFAAALNVARYTKAIDDLTSLIETNASEQQFQDHLTKNPWMFGSEYSKLLDRRTWVRDSQKDFMLRRTVDGYLEIIEIKTTLDGANLFRYDRSHGSYFPQAELSKVVGQTMHYIDLVENDSYRIQAKDQERVAKIRAKIIIGRDIGDEQIAALRTFNGYLNRIEVITFDQLVKTAQQVVAYLEQDSTLHDEDDIPF